MANGGDPADGKTGHLSDAVAVGPGQGFARQRLGKGGIHPVATCGQEQVKLAAFPLKQDRLHDLVQCAVRFDCSGLGSARLARGLDRCGVNTGGTQGLDNAGERF